MTKQGRDRNDTRTGDLLAWDQGDIVKRYDEERVRCATLRSKIARAVSETLNDYGKKREEVAEEMSLWLGEKVTKNMLDAYASEARDDHTISYLRLLALVYVTGDTRPLQTGADLFDSSVIDNKYLPWVEVGMAADQRDEIIREYEFKRRLARKGARS